VSIDQMTRAWGLQYLGWADHFSGGAIHGIGSAHHSAPHPHGTPTYLKKLHYGQRDSDSVRNLQRALNKDAPHGKILPITGFYGPLTDERVRECQGRHGKYFGQTHPDGIHRSNVGAKQAAHLHLPDVHH
jgi:hypothetical protein